MDAERAQRLEELYHSALERAPDERAVFLQSECRADSALRREVESLLPKKMSATPPGMRRGMFPRPPEVIQLLRYSDLRVYAQTA